MRQDIALKHYAETMGFRAVVDDKGEWQDGIPNNPYKFNMGNVWVWFCYKGWAVAQIDPESNKYYNHHYYEGLHEALIQAHHRYIISG